MLAAKITGFGVADHQITGETWTRAFQSMVKDVLVLGGCLIDQPLTSTANLGQKIDYLYSFISSAKSEQQYSPWRTRDNVLCIQ